MKRILPILVVVITVLLNFAYGIHPSSQQQKAKIGNSGFAGTWRGSEKCNSAGAPIAILIIADSGPSEVTLSGIYSLQGQVKAMAKGDSISIPLQEVKDPNFTNLLIEGKLIVSGNPPTVRGNIAILNNQAKDACEVQYSK
ncbi:MAG: hypothetical protein V4615_09565 [Bacteroidota bacterium]